MQIVAIFFASMALYAAQMIPAFVRILNGEGVIFGFWWWFFSIVFAVWGAFVQHMMAVTGFFVVWFALLIWTLCGFKIIKYSHETDSGGKC